MDETDKAILDSFEAGARTASQILAAMQHAGITRTMRSIKDVVGVWPSLSTVKMIA